MVEKLGRVLVLYTGGTLGMLPSDAGNPLSPLVPACWNELQKFVQALDDLPVDVEVLETTPIDSSDMRPGNWLELARLIRDNYAQYSGFVILHGTDTMTYTASALSFLLENLAKPVVLTGAQRPFTHPKTDAMANLRHALMTACPDAFGWPLIPEVCICFGGLVLRGNRARKVSSTSVRAFVSPNFPPLGEGSKEVALNANLLRKPSQTDLIVHQALEQNVLMFEIYPGLQPQTLGTLFGIEGLKGVVLRTFGAGNAPTNPEFLEAIRRGVTEKNLAIVNITQCIEGMVEMGLYDASAGLLKLGVISGVDMTPESALVKMQFLLGQGYDIETVKRLMQKNLRGEQSVNVFNLIYSEPAKADMVHKAPARQMEAGFRKDKIVKAHMRIDNATLPGGVRQGEIKLAVFMNYPSVDEQTDISIPQCLGVLKSNYNGEACNLILDCTERVSQVLNPDRPVQIALVSKTGHPVEWKGAFLSLYTSAD